MMEIKKLLIFLVAVICINDAFADTHIQMEEYGGVYRVPCSVNGAKMKFIFDTGASNVCLSMQMAEYLLDNEYINTADFVGKGSSSVADGRIVDHLVINLRDIEINGLHLYNVESVVIEGQNAPLLLGQSAIQKLGSIELNGALLTIHNAQSNNDAFIDQLFEQANKAYDSKQYSVAVDKYAQLHSMGQLSDYGKYKFAWACLMAEQPIKAYDIISEVSDYSYFEEKKIDIYRLLGFIYQDLNKYKEAANYFELSNKNIQTEYDEWIWNLKMAGDCFLDMEWYSAAAEKYQLALAVFGHKNGIDMGYIQHDCKNKLKKKQTSYRNDDVDYLIYYLLFCYERSGEWSTDAFLAEATALARADNKYAKKMLNKAGIDPYSDIW